MTIAEDTRVLVAAAHGAVEAIRALMVAKRSARHERAQAINQARALLITGPGDLRARMIEDH